MQRVKRRGFNPYITAKGDATHDFMEPARDRHLKKAVLDYLSPVCRVNGRIVNGASLPKLIQHLRHDANPRWYGIGHAYVVEQRLTSLGFTVQQGSYIWDGRETLSRIVHAADTSS